MTMRTILQILLTASVIVHFSGVIAFGVVELKRRVRRLRGLEDADSDDADELADVPLVEAPRDELAMFRRKRAQEPAGVALLTALNQRRGIDSSR